MTPWRLEASESDEDALWRLHPERRGTIARDTAALLVRNEVADRGLMLERLNRFVDEEGIDTLAELWSGAEEGSLPRALWRLYQMRQHIQASPSDVSAVVERGLDALDTIDPIVVGAQQPVTPDALVGIIDGILSGSFAGNLDEALQRASSLARVISAGLVSLAEDDHTLTLRSLAWGDVAHELAICAHRERNGLLR